MKKALVYIYLAWVVVNIAVFASCTTKLKEQPQPQVAEEQADTIMSAADVADSLETTPDSVESPRIIYNEKGRKIYLAIDIESYHVQCYTQEGNKPPKKVIFGHIYGDDGFPIMYSHRYGNNIFLVGDFMPNSNGWTVKFPIYKINAETFKMSFVADGAAVHFDKDGFKVAQCRLTNPDADCTANEIWVMHDLYYDVNGKKVREDKSEYDYERMEKEYGDSLVNSQRMSI